MYSNIRSLKLALCFAALAGISTLPPLVNAQAVYGSIFGTVTDNTGAVVPGSTITVTDVSKGTSVTTKTDAAGGYLVQHLIADTYQVQAEATGFSKTSVDNVLVYVDTQPKVDIKLTVGEVSNTVTVSGGAPLLETARADVSTIFNARALQDLPNLNRNFTSFELLTPGTSYIGWGPSQGSGNPQQSETIEVQGQLPFATGYELDGTDNQDPIIGVAVINPNIDAISEEKVTSQNYDAEFGKAVAGLVTAQTKSGANSFHGTAFEYRRSDQQQARDPFANFAVNPLTGKYLSPTLHNQFGGSVGGPIYKNRVFFFGDYQGLREKTGSSVLTTVPTALTKSSCTSGGNCDLSDYLTNGGLQAFNPNGPNDTSNSGRTAFAGNIIPAGLLSAPAVNFLKLLPAPNTGSQGQTFNNYATSGSGLFNTQSIRCSWGHPDGAKAAPAGALYLFWFEPLRGSVFRRCRRQRVRGRWFRRHLDRAQPERRGRRRLRRVCHLAYRFPVRILPHQQRRGWPQRRPATGQPAGYS